jgi:hypothetical protein
MMNDPATNRQATHTQKFFGKHGQSSIIPVCGDYCKLCECVRVGVTDKSVQKWKPLPDHSQGKVRYRIV